LYVSVLQEKLDNFQDVIPAYEEILLVFNKEVHVKETEGIVRELLQKKINIEVHSTLRIPICFDGEFGLDRKRVEAYLGKNIEEIITGICSQKYEAAFLGFLPGYAYMKGLPDTFSVPRLESPRHHIEKGSFAIAENQVGIYPNASPGGWNILGNCPIGIFDVKSDEVSLFQPGDKVEFYAISKKEHERLSDKDFSRKAYVL
jgi:inhibitor of KinA